MGCAPDMHGQDVRPSHGRRFGVIVCLGSAHRQGGGMPADSDRIARRENGY